MNLMKILSILGIGIIAALCAAASAYPISKIDAVHLVERALYDEYGIRHKTVNVEESIFHNHPAYIVTGISGPNGYCSIVDAQVARVMEIEQNGEEFYQWADPKVVGHRGTVRFAPENTIPAFEAAIAHGCDLLEIDVRETKDGELVIMHDSTLDRTTNGSGPVSEHTLAEIKQLDAGSWFGDEYKGTRVPTLREALKAMKGKALPDLDFKAGDPQKLVAIVKEAGMFGNVTMHCSDWNLLQRTQAITDKFLLRPTIPIGVVGLPIVLDKFDPPIVNVDWGQFSEELIRDIHLAGRKSFVNTMQHDTDFGIQAMLDTAPDYIQSDEVDLLVPLMRARRWKE